MNRNSPLPRHPAARRQHEPPSWPVLALYAALPVALVVVLSSPALLVAAGIGLVAGVYAGLRRRKPQGHALQQLWELVVFLRYRIGVRRRT